MVPSAALCSARVGSDPPIPTAMSLQSLKLSQLRARAKDNGLEEVRAAITVPYIYSLTRSARATVNHR